MEYKIIEKRGSLHGLSEVQIISIRKSFISFSKGFVKKFGTKKYCTFAENANHCLCFKLSDEADQNSYCLSKDHRDDSKPIMGTPLCIKSRFAKFGKYEVKQDGDWFVTECKLM